jgi:hypothetical protein
MTNQLEDGQKQRCRLELYQYLFLPIAVAVGVLCKFVEVKLTLFIRQTTNNVHHFRERNDTEISSKSAARTLSDGVNPQK